MKLMVPWSDLSVLMVVPIWAFDYIVTKIALRGLNPLVYASLRFLLASLLLLIVQRHYPKPNYSYNEKWKIATAGVVGVAIYQACYTTGLKFISASEASLLIATSPVFTVFIASALGIEKIAKEQIIGAVIAFIGVGVLIGRGFLDLHFRLIALAGYFLTLITAASFGLRSVILQPVLEAHPSIPTVTRSILVGTLTLFPASIYFILHQDWGETNPLSWLAIGYGALFSTAIGYVLWYRGIGIIGATRTMVYYYLVPLGAVLLAIVLLGEEFTYLIVLGGILILVGVTLARWKQFHTPASANETQEFSRGIDQ